MTVTTLQLSLTTGEHAAPPTNPERRGLYLMVQSPARHPNAADTLRDAIRLYTEKFGEAPTHALASYADAEAIGDDAPVIVKPVTFLATKGVLYVGRE